MPEKRRYSTLTSANDNKSRTEPQAQGSPSSHETKARIDPSTGQQSAFPGLEPESAGVDDGELFYGPAEDGLAYLRMVRAEASGVPSMLLAPSQYGISTQSSTENEMRWDKDGLDSTGFWEGEAIVAYHSGWDNPDDERQDTSGAGEEEDPQDAFYDSLLFRFTSLRDSLRLHSSSKVGATRSSDEPDLLSAVDENVNYNDWYLIFSFKKPTTRFVASLSHYATILALSRLETLLTRRNVLRCPQQTNLGVWIWSMLAHCRDLGQLPGEEVSVLRDLAKTASKLERKLRVSTVSSRHLVGTGAQTTPQRQKIVERFEGQSQHEGEIGEFEGSEDRLIESKRCEESLSEMSPDRIQVLDREMEDKEVDGPLAAVSNVGFQEREDGKQRTEEDEATRQAGELERARRRLMNLVDVAKDPPTSPSAKNTDIPASDDNLLPALMMLDSIVTVVGSIFGQRDLLEQRSAW